MSKKDYIEYKCKKCGGVLRDYGGGQDWCPYCGEPYSTVEDAAEGFKIACIFGIILVAIIIIVAYFILTTFVFT